MPVYLIQSLFCQSLPHVLHDRLVESCLGHIDVSDRVGTEQRRSNDSLCRSGTELIRNDWGLVPHRPGHCHCCFGSWWAKSALTPCLPLSMVAHHHLKKHSQHLSPLYPLKGCKIEPWNDCETVQTLLTHTHKKLMISKRLAASC